MKNRYQSDILMPQNASDRVSENLDFQFFRGLGEDALEPLQRQQKFLGSLYSFCNLSTNIPDSY